MMRAVSVVLLTFSLCIVLLMIILYKYAIGVDAYFNPLPKCTIDDFLAHARAGDLVFFWSNNAKPGSYHSYIASALQAWATETPYTHVVLVFRGNRENREERYGNCNVHFITADRYPKHDLLTNNENKVGNQFVEAESYLKGYDGRMCWHRLNTGTVIPETALQTAWQEFASRIHYDYYMKHIAFINLGLQTWDNQPDEKKTICTTTVFDFLRATGIITSDNIYTRMNRMNIGLRELEGAIRESGHYSQYPITEISA